MYNGAWNKLVFETTANLYSKLQLNADTGVKKKIAQISLKNITSVEFY